MTNNPTVQGILNNQDLFYPAPNNLAVTTLSDEFDLGATVFGQPLTLSLFSTGSTPFDTFLEVVNADNGQILAFDDNDGSGNNSLISGNEITLQGGVNYRVRVTSPDSVSPSTNNAYSLQASVAQGDISLSPRQLSQGASSSGNSVSISGQLNSADYFFPSPVVPGAVTLSDEYELDATVFGQPLTLSLFSTGSTPFDTFLQVINADTGQEIVRDDDGGNGLNSLISGNELVLQGGVNYRVRATSFGSLNPSNNNAYTLQASTPQGNVTLTPLTTDRSPEVVVPIADITSGSNAADQVISLSNTFSDADGDEISFEILSNSNSDLVSATLNASDLNLDFQDNQVGTSDITIRATANGRTVDDTFSVNISPANNGSEGFDVQYFRFQNSAVPGTYIFVEQNERAAILANPNLNFFVEEGNAFRVSANPGDGLVAVNRYSSTTNPGTFLFSTGSDFQSDSQINQSDFSLDGLAFYANGASSGNGDDYYRFENSNRPGTFLFAESVERASIIANFPVFEDQGTVWAVDAG